MNLSYLYFSAFIFYAAQLDLGKNETAVGGGLFFHNIPCTSCILKPKCMHRFGVDFWKAGLLGATFT